MVNAAKFEILYSTDTRTWSKAGQVNIDNVYQSDYHFSHFNIPAGNLYYRIKQTDEDGMFVFSKTVVLKNQPTGAGFLIYPNPASDYISIISDDLSVNYQAIIFDAAGRKLSEKILNSTNIKINTAHYPDGTYLLQITGTHETISRKIIIKH